jgi:hypothetical protein
MSTKGMNEYKILFTTEIGITHLTNITHETQL